VEPDLAQPEQIEVIGEERRPDGEQQPHDAEHAKRSAPGGVGDGPQRLRQRAPLPEQQGQLGAGGQHIDAPLGRLDSLNCIVGEHALVVIGLECRFVSEQNFKKT